MHRRHLLLAAARLAVVGLGVAPRRASAAVRAPALRVGLVLPAGDAPASARRGAELGALEADRTARLLGGSVTLVPTDGAGDARDVVRRLVAAERVVAIVGGASDAAAASLAAAADAAGVPFVNVGAADDALRGAACRALAFHVAASAAMQRDARASAAPDTSASRAADARVVLWDPALARYGAAQLNDRFRARFGAPMDGPAWAAWFAVKALWESAARARGDGPGALAAALAAGRFDGHKGRPLSFRAWDRQLRQPLYLARADGAPVEVPAAADEDDTTTLLDRLGTTAAETACRLPLSR